MKNLFFCKVICCFWFVFVIVSCGTKKLPESLTYSAKIDFMQNPFDNGLEQGYFTGMYLNESQDLLLRITNTDQKPIDFNFLSFYNASKENHETTYSLDPVDNNSDFNIPIDSAALCQNNMVLQPGAFCFYTVKITALQAVALADKKTIEVGFKYKNREDKLTKSYEYASADLGDLSIRLQPVGSQNNFYVINRPYKFSLAVSPSTLKTFTIFSNSYVSVMTNKSLKNKIKVRASSQGQSVNLSINKELPKNVLVISMLNDSYKNNRTTPRDYYLVQNVATVDTKSISFVLKDQSLNVINDISTYLEQKRTYNSGLFYVQISKNTSADQFKNFFQNQFKNFSLQNIMQDDASDIAIKFENEQINNTDPTDVQNNKCPDNAVSPASSCYIKVQYTSYEEKISQSKKIDLSINSVASVPPSKQLPAMSFDPGYSVRLNVNDCYGQPISSVNLLYDAPADPSQTPKFCITLTDVDENMVGGDLKINNNIHDKLYGLFSNTIGVADDCNTNLTTTNHTCTFTFTQVQFGAQVTGATVAIGGSNFFHYIKNEAPSDPFSTETPAINFTLNMTTSISLDLLDPKTEQNSLFEYMDLKLNMTGVGDFDPAQFGQNNSYYLCRKLKDQTTSKIEGLSASIINCPSVGADCQYKISGFYRTVIDDVDIQLAKGADCAQNFGPSTASGLHFAKVTGPASATAISFNDSHSYTNGLIVGTDNSFYNSDPKNDPKYFDLASLKTNHQQLFAQTGGVFKFYYNHDGVSDVLPLVLSCDGTSCFQQFTANEFLPFSLALNDSIKINTIKWIDSSSGSVLKVLKLVDGAITVSVPAAKYYTSPILNEIVANTADNTTRPGISYPEFSVSTTELDNENNYPYTFRAQRNPDSINLVPVQLNNSNDVTSVLKDNIYQYNENIEVYLTDKNSQKLGAKYRFAYNKYLRYYRFKDVNSNRDSDYTCGITLDGKTFCWGGDLQANSKVYNDPVSNATFDANKYAPLSGYSGLGPSTLPFLVKTSDTNVCLMFSTGQVNCAGDFPSMGGGGQGPVTGFHEWIVNSGRWANLSLSSGIICGMGLDEKFPSGGPNYRSLGALYCSEKRREGYQAIPKLPNEPSPGEYDFSSVFVWKGANDVPYIFNTSKGIKDKYYLNNDSSALNVLSLNPDGAYPAAYQATYVNLSTDGTNPVYRGSLPSLVPPGFDEWYRWSPDSKTAEVIPTRVKQSYIQTGFFNRSDNIENNTTMGRNLDLYALSNQFICSVVTDLPSNNAPAQVSWSSLGLNILVSLNNSSSDLSWATFFSDPSSVYSNISEKNTRIECTQKTFDQPIVANNGSDFLKGLPAYNIPIPESFVPLSLVAGSNFFCSASLNAPPLCFQIGGPDGPGVAKIKSKDGKSQTNVSFIQLRDTSWNGASTFTQTKCGVTAGKNHMCVLNCDGTLMCDSITQDNGANSLPYNKTTGLFEKKAMLIQPDDAKMPLISIPELVCSNLADCLK